MLNNMNSLHSTPMKLLSRLCLLLSVALFTLNTSSCGGGGGGGEEATSSSIAPTSLADTYITARYADMSTTGTYATWYFRGDGTMQWIDGEISGEATYKYEKFSDKLAKLFITAQRGTVTHTIDLSLGFKSSREANAAGKRVSRSLNYIPGTTGDKILILELELN